jgi:hypothetical protein
MVPANIWCGGWSPSAAMVLRRVTFASHGHSRMVTLWGWSFADGYLRQPMVAVGLSEKLMPNPLRSYCRCQKPFE